MNRGWEIVNVQHRGDTVSGSSGAPEDSRLGKQHTIIVEEYESFGESSFRLILGEPSRAALRHAKLDER